MPPHLRARVEEELAKEDAERAVPPPAIAPGGTRSPHTGKGAKKGMSRNEQAFARHIDGLMNGVVLAWKFEPMRLVLPAKRLSYTPDFLVLVASSFFGTQWWPSFPKPSHGLVLVEVKPADSEGRAYWGTGKSRIKAKLAAQLLADILPVVAAWQFRGQWSHEVIEPRGGP